MAATAFDPPVDNPSAPPVYSSQADELRAAARADLAYKDARYTETENGSAAAGRDGAIGWSAAAGLEFDLAPNLTLRVLGGYGQATMDDFGVSFFLPGSPPARLELSGIQVRAGLSVRF
ncbi:MAG: hypothetical protein HGA24_01965 [Candidatus Aminicenantes bacterium]|nr:hypothetical protein [Candidatus Aminicenantes bacterium]